jgi:hypothetical protein
MVYGHEFSATKSLIGETLTLGILLHVEVASDQEGVRGIETFENLSETIDLQAMGGYRARLWHAGGAGPGVQVQRQCIKRNRKSWNIDGKRQDAFCGETVITCAGIASEGAAFHNRQRKITKGVKTAVVEAGTTIGWSTLLDREVFAVGIDHYGASAPGEVLAEKFGFTATAIHSKLKAWMS